jgi:hypothetical protein
MEAAIKAFMKSFVAPKMDEVKPISADRAAVRVRLPLKTVDAILFIVVDHTLLLNCQRNCWQGCNAKFPALRSGLKYIRAEIAKGDGTDHSPVHWCLDL